MVVFDGDTGDRTGRDADAGFNLGGVIIYELADADLFTGAVTLGDLGGGPGNDIFSAPIPIAREHDQPAKPAQRPNRSAPSVASCLNRWRGAARAALRAAFRSD